MLLDIWRLTSFFDTFVIMSITMKQLLIYGTFFNLNLVASITHEVEKLFTRMAAFIFVLLTPFVFSILGEGLGIATMPSNSQPVIIESAFNFISGPVYVGLIASLGFVLSLHPLLAMLWKKLWLNIGKASVSRGKPLSRQSAQKKPLYRNSGRGIFRD